MTKPTLSAQLATAIAERDAERAAVAGLAEKLAQEEQVKTALAERVNAAELAAAELRGGYRAIQAISFAMLGQMAIGGGE